MKLTVINLLIIGSGGFLGALSRFIFIQIIGNHLFPFSTFFVNILGSFLLGITTGILLFKNNEQIYLFFSIGFLGAFTTFSTFCKDIVILIQNNNSIILFIYLLFSILFGILSFILGIYLSDNLNFYLKLFKN